ncbi:hypothetical protein, partial [Bradyrhizobium liaoningense]|uniref:hypothetical protein n=1 Tax=Bradyrhizobium liaoningense TaxID=43992 RepID=UPI002013B152
AEIRKAGSGHQSDITRADHRDSHEEPCFSLVNETPIRGGLALSRAVGTVRMQKPARELNR